MTKWKICCDCLYRNIRIFIYNIYFFPCVYIYIFFFYRYLYIYVFRKYAKSSCLEERKGGRKKEVREEKKGNRGQEVDCHGNKKEMFYTLWFTDKWILMFLNFIIIFFYTRLSNERRNGVRFLLYINRHCTSILKFIIFFSVTCL